MYENTNSSIDWKGIFLKVIIAFLVIAIAFTGIKMFTKGKVDKKQETTNIVESNSSTTFTANIEKLKEVGEKYYKDNTDKLPKDGITSMVTLNELINAGVINSLTDADGKVCDGESSYVTAVKTGDKYTIKANLVCGESYSYVTAYLAENDTKVEEKTTVTNNGSSTISNSTKVTSTKTNTSSCGTSCTPVVSTEVKQNVTINTNKNNNSSNNTTIPKRQYIVSFDGNGGTCNYNSYYVNEGEYASNPGICKRSGYNFVGWYLDNRDYNFNTPVTRDIRLVAKYTRINGYYEDDYDYDYDYNYNNNSGKPTVTTVYSIAWDRYGTENISVSHTLKVPKDLQYKNISKIRIADIEFADGITVQHELDRYKNNFSKTFIYQSNGWEANLQPKNLANITNAYFTPQSTRYVDFEDALEDGFDVTWNTSSISSQCRNVFSKINNGITVDNLCGYGISYTVTWEYILEY